jgi:filamentous hemagglutinin
VPGTESPPDPNGVYQARVEVPVQNDPDQWILKPGSSHTMFPAAWDEARLKSEVDAAWNSPTKTVAGTQWSARTPSGVKVKGYTYPRVTVYPEYEP